MTGPLPYIGGKNRLAKKIIAMLPEHTTYVEAFAGGAQVFFHKTPSRVEVLNDLDFDIVNFFRVCQWHYEELVRYRRNVQLRIPYFGSVGSVVEHTDMIATLPKRLAQRLSAISKTRIIPAPKEFHGFTYIQVWHPRYDSDPAHKWLRKLIKLEAHATQADH